MSNANQQLTLQEVSQYVRAHIGEWLAEESLAKPPVVYEIELRERMVRVEEELKHQRELMKQGFDIMEKRFESIDKRFELMVQENNKRFEEINKRFEALTQRIDRFMFWSFGITVGMGSLVIAALKLL
uniref:DUF1640 domain-containing protein n=1 Tax=Candidatus Kentrum sp. FW TaxID=2126338 RepID=A0A450TJM2_9GAMM|nr:MAG: hypothetical protein BECKFW1821C_GA0114237_101236 [Candidatus Kentron sp. FW]